MITACFTKDGKSKEISLSGEVIITSREVPDPCAVSGVRNSISRKNYPDEEAAESVFYKMIDKAEEQGWEAH